MRVPLLVVIPLCLVVIFVVWLVGAKDKNFMTPPDARRLEQVKLETLASLREPEHKPIQPPTGPSQPATADPNADPKSQKPTLDLGDLSRPPSLNEYADFTARGSDHLINVALKLEAEGEFQRALTAWERVIDHTRPNESQRETAVSSIIRLRPTLPDWNVDPAKADSIVLHAGTGKRSAEMLRQPLETLCKKFGIDSSGLVKVTPDIIAGRTDLSKSGATPVAIWFSGGAADSPSTEVLSFTFEKPDELPSQLNSSVFGLIRAYLARNTTLTQIPELPADKIDENTLKSHVTRYAWKNLAALLNQPDPNAPKAPEPARAVKPSEPEPATPATPARRSPSPKPKPKRRSDR